MDNSLHEFETELATLKPQRLSSRLIDNVASELTTTSKLATPDDTRATEPGRRWKPGFVMKVARIAGLAAAIVLSLAIFAWWKTKMSLHGKANELAAALSAIQPSLKNPAKIPAMDDGYRPVAAANILYDLKDEGLVATHTGVSAHRVRYRYLDTYTWKNNRTNASLKWSVPRDEIRLIPASFN